jgi:iron complex transport system ATP-binding protein
LIGANGSGKSTLLRALGRIIQPLAGRVCLDGKAIATMAGRDIARTLALLPQNPVSPEGLTVRQLCRFGRHPHKGMLSRTTRHDEEVVEASLIATGLGDLAERPLDRLSGGQRQRAWIAMALAQETPILLLDEPTTYLDVAHQLEVLELLKELNEKRGRTIVMVVHDLNHAAQYADHIIAVAGGGIHAAGRPVDLLKPDLIKTVFGIDAVVIPHPVDGTPLCLPFAGARAASR